MKVLNLRCAHDHRFEGWFASDEDFQSQCSQGLVACPLCDNNAVSRLPSAPRLNVSNLREASPMRPAQDAQPQDEQQAQQRSQRQSQQHAQMQWMSAMRHLLNNTEDVGARFAEEARRIHYGEVEERGIRGQASRADADALREEGIEVMAVPVPAALKGSVQ